MMTILPLTARERRTPVGASRKDVRLELTRRGRALIVLVAFLLGAVLTVAALFAFAPGASAGSLESAPTVQVEAGETLWSIAQEHAGQGESIEDYVQELQRINNLTSPRVTAGQTLELPEG